MNKENLKDKAIDSAPSILRLVLKALKYSKGGFDAQERQELGTELLALAISLLESAQED